MPVGHLYTFFGKMPIQAFAHFLIEFFCGFFFFFFAVNCMSSWYILDIKCLSDMLVVNVSHSVVSDSLQPRGL